MLTRQQGTLEEYMNHHISLRHEGTMSLQRLIEVLQEEYMNHHISLQHEGTASFRKTIMSS